MKKLIKKRIGDVNGSNDSEIQNARMHWFSYGCFNEKVNEQVLTM